MSQDKAGATGKRTLVEEGTELKGTITSSVPIVVMGKVEGEVSGPEIEVTASGVVAGRVKVKQLRSSGELAGEVDADAVKISGRVRDKTVIRARTFEVSLNHKAMEVVFGDCELAIGDEPSKEAAIAAATAAPSSVGAGASAAAVEVAAPAEPAATAAAATTAGAAGQAAPAAPVAPESHRKDGKRVPRPSEAAWDAAAGETKPAAEDEPKRRRGTLPPPS